MMFKDTFNFLTLMLLITIIFLSNHLERTYKIKLERIKKIERDVKTIQEDLIILLHNQSFDQER